jgi:OmpA-OmpF porin, OOP family
MQYFTTTTVLCAALAALSVHNQVHAQASTTNAVTGPYIGAAFGAAFGNREIDDSTSSNDEGLGRSAKIFVGYQLTENFGVQAGYVRMRDLNQNTGAGATLANQTVTGHSTYVAGTARLPLGESLALTGKVGVSFGKVTSANPATSASSSLLGSKTSTLIGTGVEYALNRHVSFAVELESYGKISKQVKGNTLTVGTRFTF